MSGSMHNFVMQHYSTKYLKRSSWNGYRSTLLLFKCFLKIALLRKNITKHGRAFLGTARVNRLSYNI